MCFAPLRALFEQLNFQKRSEKEVCFYLLAFKCASRRSFWFIIPPDGSAPSAVASLLYFLTLRSPKTLDKHSVSRLCLLLRSFSRNVIFSLLILSPLTFPAPVAASVHALEIWLQFFRWTMFCFFLWKHPRRRAELEERNSGIDAGIVWMDEFLKFKQIRYCRGQGQDRSWILDVLTGQVWACQSQSKSVFVTSSHGYCWSSVQAICCGKKLNIYASTKHFNPNPNALPKAADGAKDATKLQFVWGIIAEVGYMIGDCICT